MAKIIPLPISDAKNQPRSAHLEAAWMLVYTALWQYDDLPKPEIAYAQRIIRQALAERSGLKPAFIKYCERIILANRLLAAEPSQWVDVPSIWFHPDYADGFMGTLSTHRQYCLKRQAITGYQQGIATFAAAYWDYINHPHPSILKICRKRLLRLREYGLLQLWNNVIMHHQSK